MFVKFVVLLRILLNHLVNIPINFILGSGKTFAFVTAFTIDILQIIGYSYILEKGKIQTKFTNFISKLLPEKQEIENSEFVKSIRKFGYFGVLILSALPIYVGGVWSAVVTSYALSLDRKKSILCLIIGSLIGCFIWVLGIIYILTGLKYLFLYIISKMTLLPKVTVSP